MNERSTELGFTAPYEIAAVRPLRQTTLPERRTALRAAGFNTELIPQGLVYIDLKTDSGVSALTTAQLAGLVAPNPLESGMELAAEASGPFRSLAERFREYFGFPHMLAVAQGRAAERLWMKLHVQPGSVVAGNMLFPSTRFHVESNGGRVLDVIADAAHDLTSSAPFKGDVDLQKLTAVFREHPDKVACVYVELCVNSCGGQPVSLANLRAVKAVAAAHRVPLFLDACRILENSFMVREREAGCQDRSVAAIVRETCDQAGGCTLSALKDFSMAAGGFIGTRDEAAWQKAHVQSFLDGVQLPSVAMATLGVALDEAFASDGYSASRVRQVHDLWHRLQETIPLVRPAGGHALFIDAARFLPDMPEENFRAEALAAFLFEISGIRATKGPPLAPSQTSRGVELLRLALPARRYLQQHMDDVVTALLCAYARRNEIKGLRRVEQAGRGKYAPALFTRMEA